MGAKLKYTIKDACDLAIKNGGKCLSIVYVRCDKKLQWECSCGYVWYADFHSIKRGAWCTKCRHKAHTIEECKENRQKEKIMVVK